MLAPSPRRFAVAAVREDGVDQEHAVLIEAHDRGGFRRPEPAQQPAWFLRGVLEAQHGPLQLHPVAVQEPEQRAGARTASGGRPFAVDLVGGCLDIDFLR